MALNNCLRHARDEGLLGKLPTENWAQLEHRAVRRPLWSWEQIEKVCQSALSECKNGQLLADYIRFLAFSGVRRNEALQIKWTDIDFSNGRLTVRVTKYGATRDVELNPALETFLRGLRSRAPEDQEWLFPSPRAGDEATRTLQASLEAARREAGLREFCFHDLRHYFISTCVMAGID
jgi:integrase